jgi:hypothetical protein
MACSFRLLYVGNPGNLGPNSTNSRPKVCALANRSAQAHDNSILCLLWRPSQVIAAKLEYTQASNRSTPNALRPLSTPGVSIGSQDVGPPASGARPISLTPIHTHPHLRPMQSSPSDARDENELMSTPELHVTCLLSSSAKSMHKVPFSVSSNLRFRFKISTSTPPTRSHER